MNQSPTIDPARPGTPEVSFVVIAFNEERNIERTLDGILAQRGVEAFEVVVVDDGSSDATATRAETRAQADPRVRVIRLARNRGRGYARAAGVEAARAALLAT